MLIQRGMYVSNCILAKDFEQSFPSCLSYESTYFPMLLPNCLSASLTEGEWHTIVALIQCTVLLTRGRLGTVADRLGVHPIPVLSWHSEQPGSIPSLPDRDLWVTWQSQVTELQAMGYSWTEWRMSLLDVAHKSFSRAASTISLLGYAGQTPRTQDLWDRGEDRVTAWKSPETPNGHVESYLLHVKWPLAELLLLKILIFWSNPNK